MFNFSFFEISSLQRRILSGIGLVAIAGSIFLFRHSKSEEIALLPPPITTVAATITVDVSGAVNQPGAIHFRQTLVSLMRSKRQVLREVALISPPLTRQEL